MFAPKHILLAACTACTLTITPALAQQRYNLGRPATPAEIAGWDIDVKADGTGLPKGRGTVAAGAAIFAEKCAACHGAKGEGSVANKLAGGGGTLNTAGALKTVGSFWPYPTTLFDYIRRAMPHNAPQSLKSDEVYSLTAFILNVNGVIDAKAEMNQATLPKVQMPNKGGFKQVVD
ncbi:MAG: cytochrome [Betaproteobacteria bacterium]|nr:cytochrome [Betaproteobacteria bacterium]